MKDAWPPIQGDLTEYRLHVAALSTRRTTLYVYMTLQAFPNCDLAAQRPNAISDLATAISYHNVCGGDKAPTSTATNPRPVTATLIEM